MADEFTIDIPGATEIFRVVPKSLEDKELRQKRVTRMLTSNSPMPEPLRWIPSVINAIDDVEDLMTTALVLGRPLLKRLPSRFVPVVGWVLLIGDLVNLTTGLLGLVSGGRGGKRVLKNATQFYGKKKLIPTKRAASFFNRVPVLGSVLQAAQVAENLTGFGLRLGGIMGLLNDSFWGAVRKFQGKKVIFRGPPSSELGAKAARVLNQVMTLGDSNIPLDLDDMDLLIQGHALASAILREQPNNGKVFDRIDLMCKTEQPTYIPWNETSRVVLQENGIAFDDSIKPYVFSEKGNETMGDIIKERTNSEFDFQNGCKKALKRTERAHFMQLIYDSGAIDVVEGLNDGEQMFDYQFTQIQRLAMRMVEFNIFPLQRMSRSLWDAFVIFAEEKTGSPIFTGITEDDIKAMFANFRKFFIKKEITELDPNDPVNTPWFVDLTGG